MLWSIMMRLGFRAEIFAGVAQAITEILGTDKIPGVQAAVAEITLYAQTLRAYTVATIHESVEWCGLQVPNPPLVTAGRLYSINEYPRITYLMKDLCGQALISRWPEKVWDHPEFGPLLEATCPAPGSRRARRTSSSASSGICSWVRTPDVSACSRTSMRRLRRTSHISCTSTRRSQMARFAREYAGDLPRVPHIEHGTQRDRGIRLDGDFTVGWGPPAPWSGAGAFRRRPRPSTGTRSRRPCELSPGVS